MTTTDDSRPTTPTGRRLRALGEERATLYDQLREWLKAADRYTDGHSYAAETLTSYETVIEARLNGGLPPLPTPALRAPSVQPKAADTQAKQRAEQPRHQAADQTPTAPIKGWIVELESGAYLGRQAMHEVYSAQPFAFAAVLATATDAQQLADRHGLVSNPPAQLVPVTATGRYGALQPQQAAARCLETSKARAALAQLPTNAETLAEVAQAFRQLGARRASVEYPGFVLVILADGRRLHVGTANGPWQADVSEADGDQLTVTGAHQRSAEGIARSLLGQLTHDYALTAYPTAADQARADQDERSARRGR